VSGDDLAAGRVAGRAHVAGTPVKILVPGNHLMAGLLGQRDELLRQIEGAFPDVRIAVRGNEVSLEGTGPTGSRPCSRN